MQILNGTTTKTKRDDTMPCVVRAKLRYYAVKSGFTPDEIDTLTRWHDEHLHYISRDAQQISTTKAHDSEKGGGVSE